MSPAMRKGKLLKGDWEDKKVLRTENNFNVVTLAYMLLYIYSMKVYIYI